MKLRMSSRGAHPARQGVALVYAVFGTFVVVSMVTVMFTMAGVSDRQADVVKGRTQARYLAEGALRTVVKDLQVSLANWDEPTLSGVKVVNGREVSFEMTELGGQVSYTDASGVTQIVQPYEIETRVKVDGVQGMGHRMVNAVWTPLFQFAVFYNNDLEVHAGPNMTLRGRVHSNRDMYLGGGSTITLDTNYVRAVGGIFRADKYGNARGGSVDVRKWVADPFDPSEPSVFERLMSQSQFAITSASGYDSAFSAGYDENGDGRFDGPNDVLPFAYGAEELWSEPEGYSGGSGQTLKTGLHGVEEAVTPPLGSIQMYEEVASGSFSLNESSGEYEYVGAGLGTHDKGYYFDNAGLSIVIDAEGRSFVATDAAGNDITSFVASAMSLVLVPDMRQSGGTSTPTVALEVDIAALAATPYFPTNGLIYAGHGEMGEGVAARGVMLTNGSELPAGLSVVSPGAIYVQGDYNTVDKKGASVIGDAVNLLSNSWDGTKTPGTLPSASETTYNFAMVTGAYESEPGRYSGGLENLPRFHENWSGVPCNIAGSFVNLYDSQFATGDWGYGGDRYTAPIRNWQYDDAFNTLADLPPYTPMAVTTMDVATW